MDPFFKQQTIQVALLMEALDQAYEKIRSLEAQKNKREEEDADEDSVDKEKIIEEKIIEKEEEDDDVNECEEENIKHNDEDKEGEEGRKEGRQKAITGLLWCGTSYLYRNCSNKMGNSIIITFGREISHLVVILDLQL